MSRKDPPSDQPRPRRKGGTPPKEHQWPKGVSGNPGGRPKKTPTLRDTLTDYLAASPVHPRTGERVTRLDLLAETMFRAALQKPSDAIHFARWLEGAQPPPLADSEPMDSGAGEDQAILDAALQRMLRRELLGEARKGRRRNAEDDQDG
jgi:hypothetical protein